MTSRSSAPSRCRTRPSHSRNHHPEGQEIVAHNSLSSEVVQFRDGHAQSTTATTRAKWKPVAYPKSAASWSTSQVGCWRASARRAREVSVLESDWAVRAGSFSAPAGLNGCAQAGRGARGRKSVQSESAVRCGAWRVQVGPSDPSRASLVHL